MINLDMSFLFQFVNFLLLMLVLNLFLFKPIRKVLVDRNAEITGAKEKTAAVDKEVQEKFALYETRMREIKASATDERSVLKKAAQAEEAAILDKARKEATDTLCTIKNKVAKEAADARQLARHQGMGNHADHFARLGQHGVGQHAHQPDAPAAKDHSQPAIEQCLAELLGGLAVGRSRPSVGSAKHAASLHRRSPPGEVRSCRVSS